jgi:hypothetical protein
MMRPNTIDIDVADANLTGFASNVTGASFTITTNATTDGLAHQVSIRNDSATDHSGKTVTLVGTDANDNALTEVVTAPGSSATVESSGYFKTLTSATPSATINADTFDIGWVDEVASHTYPIDWRSDAACNISVDVAGTIDFTVQETFVDVLGGTAPIWVNISALAAKTQDTTSSATVGATAIRVIVNSYSSGAELQVYTTQPTRS